MVLVLVYTLVVILTSILITIGNNYRGHSNLHTNPYSLHPIVYILVVILTSILTLIVTFVNHHQSIIVTDTLVIRGAIYMMMVVVNRISCLNGQHLTRNMMRLCLSPTPMPTSLLFLICD